MSSARIKSAANCRSAVDSCRLVSLVTYGFMSSRYSQFLVQHRRAFAAFVLSVSAHALALTGAHWEVVTPPVLAASRPLQIRIVTEKVATAIEPAAQPKVARARSVPRPNPTATRNRTAAPTKPASADPLPEPAALSPAVAATPVAPEPVEPSAAATTPVARAAAAPEALIEARSDVATLNNPKPPYPLVARRRGLEGEVLLAVHVSREGLASEVHVKQSSGHALLDGAALDTVRRWRFVPAQRGNVRVDSDVEVPIRFRLQR